MNTVYANIKNFRTNLIFKKYFKIIFLWMLIPCIIFDIILYAFFNHNSKTSTYAHINDITNVSTNKIDNSIDNINKFYNGLISNNEIISYFLQDTYNNKNKILYKNISQVLHFSTMFDTIITDVSLYNQNMGYVFSNNIGGFIEDLPIKQYYKTLKNYGNNPIFESNDHNGKKIISFCFKINIYQKDCGYIVIDIDKNTFLDYYALSLYDDSITNLILYSPINNLAIYTNGNKIINDKDFIKIVSKIKEEDNNNVKYIEYKNQVFSYNSLNNWNMYVITAANFSKRNEINSLILLYILIITAMLIILSLILSFFSSTVLYKEILKFARHLECIVLGTTADTPYMEFKPIANDILKLKNENNDMSKSISEHLSKLNKLQYLALQMQINPHFLFNTLNLINSYIIINGGSDDETLLISNLSDILYYTLTTTEFFVPFSKEIEYCKKYLEIESIKYKNSFDCIWDIPQELMSEQIIRMSLQPIIENAIKHGIRNMIGKRGKIIIKAYKNSESITVEISNNGAAIPPEKLKELRSLMASDILPENKHIGLLNVNQRCKLLYGDNYKINIFSTENITKFILKFPISSD